MGYVGDCWADSIRVQATASGLPTNVALTERALTVPPEQLAGEILHRCRLAACRAQVAQRRELCDRGFEPSLVNSLGLATERDLAHAEAEMARREADTDAGRLDGWAAPRR